MDSLAYRIAITNKELNDSFRDYFKGKFDSIRVLNTPYGEMGSIVYHLFSATNIWLNRIANENNQIKSYNDLTSEQDFFNEWITIDNRFIRFTQENTIDYAKLLSVQTSSGEKFTISIEDALLHLSHHAFLHRGHLGALIRIHNLNPLPGLDWVDITKGE